MSYRDSPPLELPSDGDFQDERWSTLIELVNELRQFEWVLIGAQMVALHGLARGRTPPRFSADLDLLIDIRVLGTDLPALRGCLEGLGFQVSGVSTGGVAHRMERGNILLDLLLPDHLGERADRELVPGGLSVEVPGGRRALQNAEGLSVAFQGSTAVVPIPNLLGAIIVKVRAIEVDDLPEAQKREVAFLLCLVQDPDEMAKAMPSADRRALAAIGELADHRSDVWAGLSDAEIGSAAFAILTEG